MLKLLHQKLEYDLIKRQGILTNVAMERDVVVSERTRLFGEILVIIGKTKRPKWRVLNDRS